MVLVEEKLSEKLMKEKTLALVEARYPASIDQQVSRAFVGRGMVTNRVTFVETRRSSL